MLSGTMILSYGHVTVNRDYVKCVDVHKKFINYRNFRKRLYEYKKVLYNKETKMGGVAMEPKKCPKCGREAAENMAFCADCLAEMEKYPVKPGVVVLLPQREKESKPVRRRHAPPTPEEQLAKLKKRIRGLILALILALGAAGVFGWMAATDFLNETDVKLPGQNYSSETPLNPKEWK